MRIWQGLWYSRVSQGYGDSRSFAQLAVTRRTLRKSDARWPALTWRAILILQWTTPFGWRLSVSKQDLTLSPRQVAWNRVAQGYFGALSPKPSGILCARCPHPLPAFAQAISDQKDIASTTTNWSSRWRIICSVSHGLQRFDCVQLQGMVRQVPGHFFDCPWCWWTYLTQVHFSCGAGGGRTRLCM